MSFGFGMGFTRNDPFAGGPSLNLQFAGNTVLDPSITFTRALNTATYFNSAGVLTTANANVPRFDYDPVTLAPRGLLIEEQRTNLLTYSEDWTNAAWVKSRSSITANATVSPDGTSNADKLVEDTTASATHRVYQQVAKAASSVTRTFAVYLKAAERTFARVSVSDNTESVVARADVNLSTGTITAASVAGGSSISAASSNITPAGNGWYRCSVTATFDATITTPGAFVFICDALSSISYTGNGTSGIFIWGAQWEDGAFSTSYIPTVASQVTRNADSAVMTGANFSSWYNSTNGTIFFEYGPSPTLTVDRRWLSINDTTTANRFVLNKTANLTTDGAFAVAGGVGQTIATSSVNTSSASVIRLAFSYEAAGTSMSSQGSVAATAGAITLPTVTQMNIGTDRGLFPANSWIRRITYYPRRLSNAELQSITS